MSRPARRPARIRPPHRGRTPSVSSANRPTREVQPFVRPVPPRTRGIKLQGMTHGPEHEPKFPTKEQIALLLVVLAIISALVFVQMNSNLIAH